MTITFGTDTLISSIYFLKHSVSFSSWNACVPLTLTSAKNNLAEIMGVLRHICNIYAGDPCQGPPLSEVSGKQLQYHHCSGNVLAIFYAPSWSHQNQDWVQCLFELSPDPSKDVLHRKNCHTEYYNCDYNKNWMKAASHWKHSSYSLKQGQYASDQAKSVD